MRVFPKIAYIILFFHVVGCAPMTMEDEYKTVIKLNSYYKYQDFYYKNRYSDNTELLEDVLYRMIKLKNNISDVDKYLKRFKRSKNYNEVYYLYDDWAFKNMNWDAYLKQFPNGIHLKEVENDFFKSISQLSDCSRYLILFSSGKLRYEVERKCYNIAVSQMLFKEFIALFPQSNFYEELKPLIEEQEEKELSEQSSMHEILVSKLKEMKTHPTFVYSLEGKTWLPGKQYSKIGPIVDRDTFDLLKEIEPFQGACIDGIALHLYLRELIFEDKNCNEHVLLMPMFTVNQKLGPNSYLVTTTFSFLFEFLIGTNFEYTPVIIKTSKTSFTSYGKANLLIWVKYVGELEAKDSRGFDRKYKIFQEYDG